MTHIVNVKMRLYFPHRYMWYDALIDAEKILLAFSESAQPRDSEITTISFDGKNMLHIQKRLEDVKWLMKHGDWTNPSQDAFESELQEDAARNLLKIAEFWNKT